MAKETIETPMGVLKRSHCDHVSPLLEQSDTVLGNQYYPDPEPACVVCPAGRWYVTNKGLFCHCAERSYISWATNTDTILFCDDSERLIQEAEDRQEQLRAASRPNAG